ncbi:MAG TPA: SigE family RNA polymerase sigma factor [Acidimicrobiales bacterium]|nr:SigE family RNA polymerase sigma factor [Acidimicrobiales bacterium]
MRSKAAKAEVDREFDRFVADHGDSLLRTAYLVAWDLGEAEDLVQECLLRVARRWPRVRVMEFPTAYARRILMNLVLDTSNHRSRQRGELSGPSDAAPVDHGDPAAVRSFTMVEARTDLLSGLGELAPRQRAVLVLRYFEDLTEAQTADALGCSIGTVKSSASQAINRMRQTSVRDVPQLRIPAHVHKGDNR